MSKKLAKELEDKINRNLSADKPKKKATGAPAKLANTKPAPKSGFQDERIFVKVDLPVRALNHLFKAASLPLSNGTRITAKVSTFKSISAISFVATVRSGFSPFADARVRAS
jgi:hypothetical protein